MKNTTNAKTETTKRRTRTPSIKLYQSYKVYIENGDTVGKIKVVAKSKDEAEKSITLAEGAKIVTALSEGVITVSADTLITELDKTSLAPDVKEVITILLESNGVIEK